MADLSSLEVVVWSEIGEGEAPEDIKACAETRGVRMMWDGWAPPGVKCQEHREQLIRS